ncbi:putative helicase mov-10-B.2 [Trichoplusia ni]|uniref:RNA helicase n=1 Tax=Trichoplusia ni TaxID=7111 RepID=A0A7E5W267_TRINI|nr:putative helicase mov-10-B.2 [Trichoplusia ni]
MDCEVCKLKKVEPEHYETEKHIKNKYLRQFALNKSHFVNYKKGLASVSCDVQSSFSSVVDQKEGKINISAKPNEEVIFKFTIRNDSHKSYISIAFIKLVHSQFNFIMNRHSFETGCIARTLPPQNKLTEEITVTFSSPEIGQYETPIIFFFHNKDTNDHIVIMREMVVFVEGTQVTHNPIISPYARKQVWAKMIYKSSIVERCTDVFCVPKKSKEIFYHQLKLPDNADEMDIELLADIKKIFTTGVTKDNYVKFFHNLLWLEETMIRANLKNYNMSAITMKAQMSNHHGPCYALEVPGLGEKRPSLMIGDMLHVKPHAHNDFMFEAVVKDINDNVALVGGLSSEFTKHYGPTVLFDIRFFMSRIPLERMHHAVHNVRMVNQESRIFPKENKNMCAVQPISNFFNVLVEGNLEQRCAVERIVSGSPGAAPYLLHGPPGTGKTVTIVEAILQLVHRNPKNRIMVCTDSNMAADHVATMIIRYSHMFGDKFMLRASSKFRNWDTLPECLAPFSNGTCRQNFENVEIEDFRRYKIVITTLSHAAKFGRAMRVKSLMPHISQLFIDEAAQASEPACLIPVCGLLTPGGTLVLAGDPQQLGPVVISSLANKQGFGISLMERLKKSSSPLYSDIRNDPNYVVMLRNNFRSNPDIIDIPDKLFYKGQLRALAKEDTISNIDILGEHPHSRAVVFHGVLSKEQRIGKSPSFFNVMECEIVQLYVKRLVMVHNVLMQDIGIVTPYIRQVYQIKKSLKDIGYDKIEVGTVEAYQGKEKRIIIISTVRANCNLLEHDAKFQLGFLVDHKRFNVAITRAKAKVIIIGNPLCLERDSKWQMYIQKCRELGTYHGFDSRDFDDERCREIVDSITPMLAKLKAATATKKPKKKKLKTSTSTSSSHQPDLFGDM